MNGQKDPRDNWRADITPCRICRGSKVSIPRVVNVKGAADFQITEFLRDSKSTHIDSLPSGRISQTHSGL